MPRRATALRAAGLLLIPLALPTALPAAVLVELFTSQGCSSCPPADRLLTRLGDDPQLAGEVVPLAFHVDYWNWIGWRDPFSQAAWSQRQRGYAGALRGGRVYTPQALVGGRRDCNGGDLRCIRAAVAEAARQPAGEVTLVLGSARPGALAVGIGARPPAGAGALDVMVAVFEKALETPVGRGENASKTLRNEFVVRRLQLAFRLDGTAARRATLTVPIEASWRRGHLGVAAFLQDPRTRQVFAAASAPVPPR
jgi:hypothetical protein